MKFFHLADDGRNAPSTRYTTCGLAGYDPTERPDDHNHGYHWSLEETKVLWLRFQVRR
jgi:hypothetical protein